MISFPTTPTTLPAGTSWRAGGTNLTERRRLGVATGPVADLRDLPGLDHVEVAADGSVRVGARVALQDVADHPGFGRPGLTAAFGGLATPQVRRRATFAGGLLQDARCPYYRSDEPDCLKKGGSACSARRGEAAFHSVIDLGACIAPHPSTPLLAWLAFDGSVALADGTTLGAAALAGDGTDPRRTHTLPDGALIVAGTLPPPWPGERSAWVRYTHRARAEWPLVECVVRVVLAPSGAVERAVLAVGGVANVPLRFDAVAQALVGVDPRDDAALAAALAPTSEGAGSIPQSAWRGPLIAVCLADGVRAAVSA